MNSSHEELPPTANEVREAKLGVLRAAAWLVHLSDTSAGMPSAANEHVHRTLALAVRRLEELQERQTAWLAAHEEELFAGVGVDGERRS